MKHRAILYYKEFGHQPRNWGYEVRLHIWDDSQRSLGVGLFFPKKPTEKELAEKIAKKMDKLEKTWEPLHSPKKPEPTYTKTDVEEILLYKNYLAVGQHFPEDLPINPNPRRN